MSETPAEPRLTLRIGQEVFNDVLDYVVLIRTKEGKIDSRTSSYCWAHGAMAKTITMIEAHNCHQAHEPEEGDDEQA